MLRQKTWLTEAGARNRLSVKQQRELEEWVANYDCLPVFYETGSCVYAELEYAPDLRARKYFSTPSRQRVAA